MEELLESSKQRPGILLNILQCTGHPPPTKTIWSELWQVINPALEDGEHKAERWKALSHCVKESLQSAWSTYVGESSEWKEASIMLNL